MIFSFRKIGKQPEKDHVKEKCKKKTVIKLQTVWFMEVSRNPPPKTTSAQDFFNKKSKRKLFNEVTFNKITSL